MKVTLSEKRPGRLDFHFEPTDQDLAVLWKQYVEASLKLLGPEKTTTLRIVVKK